MPRDYSGQNLRGRSFKGQNLTGDNFSQADIRGANFTNANLKGADFTGAKAGLQRRWVIGLLIITLLLSALSGLFSTASVVLVYDAFDKNIIAAIVALVTLVIFSIITDRNLLAGLVMVPVAYVIIVVSSATIALSIQGISIGSLVLAFIGVVTCSVTFTFVFSFAFTFIFAIFFTIFFASIFAIILGNFFPPVPIAIVFAVAVVFVIFSAYIGWRSLNADYRDTWLRSYAIVFAATGGTSFHGADLTDADFTGATLKNTDFRKANL
ncbi:MAG: pentapeptide repeat-containing protein, partial [Dolichospermum sp.]